MKTSIDDALDDIVGPPAAKPAPPAAAVPVAGLTRVRVDQLHPSANNPREKLTGIADLAESIRANGLIQPIIAQQHEDGRLVIVAGHRRHAAVQSLGWLHVETIVRKAMRPDDELAAMLVENGQRAGLDPIEEARALRRLQVQTGCTVAELAKRVGRGQPTISARLALLSLSVEEQEAVRAKQLNIGEAVQKARVDSGTKRREGYTHSWYLGAEHPLARNARSRCQRLHPKARLIGATACGECWESVVRADERQHIHAHSARTGECSICSQPMPETSA